MAAVEIVLFDVFAFSGMFLLVIVILTAWGLPATVPRSATWFTFLISSLLASIIVVLIVGRQTGPEPMKILCDMQAILVKSVEVWNAFAGAALLAQVYLKLSYLEHAKTITYAYIWLLCAMPLFLFFIVILVIAGFRLEGWQSLAAHRDSVGMLCRMESKPISYLVNGITAVGILIMIILKVLILIKIRQFRKETGKCLKMQYGMISDIARGFICNFFAFASLISCVLGDYSSQKWGLLLDGYGISLFPLLVGITYATQKDVIYSWMYRRWATEDKDSFIV